MAHILAHIQILVIGHNEHGCDIDSSQVAYKVGYNIAKQKAVLITGGMGGIMSAASRGAHDAKGIVVGITPHTDTKNSNEFCDVVIPTGLGYMRNFINVYAADGVIIVGGGVGTLSEICAAYMYNKPMVAIRDTGGMADQMGGKYLDYRKKQTIHQASTPDEAVSMILSLLCPGE